jgi:hypothetical protein
VGVGGHMIRRAWKLVDFLRVLGRSSRTLCTTTGHKVMMLASG